MKAAVPQALSTFGSGCRSRRHEPHIVRSPSTQDGLLFFSSNPALWRTGNWLSSDRPGDVERPRFARGSPVMTTQFHLRPPVDDLVFQLYGRPVHPELFDILARRRIRCQDFTLQLWLTTTGHVISWQ